MVQMSRDLDCQYKTAFVLAHKIRRPWVPTARSAPLEGDVEVDGMYNGGYVRPANLKEDRVDRRKCREPHRQAPRRYRLPFPQGAHLAICRSSRGGRR